jgi:hypothetical protein
LKKILRTIKDENSLLISVVIATVRLPSLRIWIGELIL